MQKHKLYVGRLQEIPSDAQYSYYDSDLGALLLYTDTPPKGDFVEVSDDLVGKLPDVARAWLFSVKTSANKAFADENEDELTELAAAFLANFEAELKKETKKKAKGAAKNGKDANKK